MQSKDKVKAHLDKSSIKSVLQLARASLKEPSRPFTPGEQPRSLFSNGEVTRPPSSYNLKSFTKELEPIKPKQLPLEAPLLTGRKNVHDNSKSGPRKPVKVVHNMTEKVDRIVFDRNLREVLDEDFKSSEVNQGTSLEKSEKSEKVEEFEEFEEVCLASDVLKKIDRMKDLKNITSEDLEEILQEFSESLADLSFAPASVTVKQMLKSLAMTLEVFQDDLRKVLKICKCLLENVTTHDLLMLRSKKKGITTNPLALGAMKFLYQFSKNSENDLIFLSEDLLETFYSVLLSVMSEDSYQNIDLPYEFLLYMLGTLKNISNCSEVAENCFHFFKVFTSLLPNPYLEETPIASSKHSELLVQVTGILKNLTNDQSLESLLDFQILEKLAVVIFLYKDNEIQLNSYKALAKVSAQEVVSASLRPFSSVFIETIENTSDVLILTRALYLQANILSAFPTLVQVSFNNLFYHWVKTVGKNDDLNVDLLVKITRFANNLLSFKTYTVTAQFLAELLKNLLETLARYSAGDFEELVLNSVSCISNLVYFDLPGACLLTEHDRICTLSKVSSLLVDSFNEEITAEVLRTISNLTRHESVCRQVSSLHLVEIFLLMLGHSNWNVVYFTLGCLINVSANAKEVLYCERVFEVLIDLVADVEKVEVEFCQQILMVFCNLCSTGKGIVPWTSVAGEENVVKLHEVVKRCTAQECLKPISEDLLIYMPKPWVSCPFPGCGRKFETDTQLSEHKKRRHE
jgi:hypothetical protein